MIEIPEAATLARQLNETVRGKRIVSAEANHSPHKFAWFTSDPAGYNAMLSGREVLEARASAGAVELMLSGGLTLFFTVGAVLRYHKPSAKQPDKHQLLLCFNDGGALTASIQMYGGLSVYPDDKVENPYLSGNRVKPNPLTGAFDKGYFDQLLADAQPKTMSVKAFLATEQRIPGLGNGALQDILFSARLQPRAKLDIMSDVEYNDMYNSIVNTLKEMAEKGGRDTETDLFGMKGRYPTILSRNTMGTACPRCGGTIVREAYLGGNVYYCPGCQKKS
jgi:formamidopyrimidine-DNA glycosylase